MIARWLLVVFALLGCLGCAKQTQTHVAEVAGAAPCGAPQCVAIAQAEDSLTFRSIEPSFLPFGFHLSVRRVVTRPLPMPLRETLAAQRNVPLTQVPESVPAGLALEYRFANSDFVPAITVYEEKADTPAVSFELERPGCAEKIPMANGTVIYGLGKGTLNRGPTPGVWMVCAQVDPDEVKSHVAFFASGDVIVQVRAFPEANISREDFLKMAASFRPAP